MPDVLYQPFPMQGHNRGQIWRYAPQYRRPRHFHSEPELNLVCAGSGAFGTGDRRFTLTAGDLVWWAPGVDHELLETTPDFDLFVIGATAEFAQRIMERSGHEQVLTHTARVADGTLPKLRSACELPLSELEPVALENRVADLWREACELDDGVDVHTLTRRSISGLASVHGVSRGELAQVLNTHPSEVSRHFRRDTGLTLTQYRTRLRLLRFIAAADAGDSLLAAANVAGFGSYSQCHRAFRAVLACSPREFFSSELRQVMSGAFAPW